MPDHKPYVRRNDEFKERKCAICKKVFMQNEFSKLVCSPECKEEHRKRSVEKSIEAGYRNKKLKKPIYCALCGKEFWYKYAYTRHKNDTIRRQERGLMGCHDYEKNILKAKNQRIVERTCAICGKYFTTELKNYRDEAWEKENEMEQRRSINDRGTQTVPVCSEECRKLWEEKYDRSKWKIHYQEEESFSSSPTKDNGKGSGNSPVGIKFKKTSTILIF